MTPLFLPIRWLLTLFFSLFYDRKYLQGKYFTTKKMGFYWCFIDLPSRLWGANRKIPWPVNPRTIVSNKTNIIFDINDIHMFQVPGCYWQNHRATITIGKGCHIAPNVGIITTNHDPKDPSKHLDGKDISIGPSCWIGMNAVILPGVILGENTVVAAGAVVTKSFPQGHCIVGGVPAKIIRSL